MGLVNRVVDNGTARSQAEALAHEITRFPNACMLADRDSVYGQHQLPMADALLNELRAGLELLETDVRSGAQRFVDGSGRSGRFDD